ncbi:MAG TPA: PSD1 and planctomycete cytochrome C domain-containing protein, partial [Gemmataceae bacterium]|nr:PSD1 and planctomycete cytochrome C domain-containing protein [Gemmataceae bacterium]
MKTCLSRLALIGTLLLCPGSAVTAADAAPTIDFNRDIRPILSDNCFACHGPDQAKRKARLRLDTRDDAVARGLIIPGNHAKSPLFERLIATDDEGHMPPRKTGKRLSSSQVKLLGQWIDQGAPYSRHWAYTPPPRAVPPVVKSTSWPRNPIDRFVLHRLEQERLHPSPETDPATLLRRVTLDLTGLPPTLDEIDAFLADQRPDAYERVVDRLLASPHHGERMAQHWLDLARYADTNGYRLDNHRDVWRWRDWVIDAFNANMPFDQFTIEQLAGDLLPRPTLEQRIATGFHRNTMVNFGNGSDPKEYLARAVMDRVATTGTVWLGTTFGCVQCHDHKYDPFTQKDYYRLFAFFNNVPEKGLDGERSNPVPSIQAPTREQAHKLAILQQQRAGLAASLPALRSPLLATPFFRRLDELKTAESELLRAVPSAMVMEEMPRPRTTRVLLRGDYLNEGEVVTPGVPASLPPLKRGLPANRLDLARWLVDSENPLTARVTVNRLWQFHFGTGLVRTGDDFGSQGEPPSHPELLDWLATEFVRSGWDLKAMHRLIVTSATYR